MKTTTKTRIRYRATFQAGNIDGEIKTRWYPLAGDAQDALSRRREVGYFAHLGRVHGDAYEADGRCYSAPRNGGLVSLERQED